MIFSGSKIMALVALLFLLTISYSASYSAAQLPPDGQERFGALQRHARESYGAGEYRQALEHYEDMQQMLPDSGEVAYNRGSVLLEMERYEAAVSTLSLALELDFPPDFGLEQVHFNRGLAFTALGEYDRALRDYERAWELNQEDARPLNNRGVVLLRLGDQDEALRSFELARELNRDYPDPLFHLGVIFSELGYHHEAVESFQNLLDIDSSFPDARFNLGNALYRAGQFEEALQEFMALHQENPAAEDVLYNLGLSALAAATGRPVHVVDQDVAAESAPITSP